MKLLRRYWQVWLLMASNEAQVTFVNRAANIMFFIGKSLRYVVMITFLLLLRSTVKEVGGYQANQIMVFFITYHFTDLVLQIFFRGVYEFGTHVRNGTFDGILLKPISPLFRVLTGTPDLNDVIFLIPSTIISVFLLLSSDIHMSFISFLLYLVLLLNALLIGTAIHIIILSLTLLANDVDNIMWIYRDVSRLGQFPTTIYFEFIRLTLFFIIPIGVMTTIPAQALLNTPLSLSVSASFAMGIIFFLLSLRFWQWSVKKYSGASS